MPARRRWSSATAATFRATEAELRALPGIGAYTAAAIAAIAFDAPASPVDGNIERVIARLYAVEDALPAAKPAIRACAAALTPQRRAGDFAQAMMDLGATICTPKKPACALCPWIDACAARARGDPETFPRKAPKAEGKLRRGAAFVVVRADGFVLVRTRPAKGLLGGMTEVPTTRGRTISMRATRSPRRRSFAASARSRGGACRARSPMCSRISRWSSWCMSRIGAARRTGARRHALGHARRSRRRGAADRDAQGLGARAWLKRFDEIECRNET